jgi:hypothetical protein
MSRRNLFGWVLLVALAMAPGVGRAQILIKRDDRPLPIDQATAAAVVKDVLKLLTDNYVFPDAAAKMNTAVSRRLENKEYARVKTGQELAKLLTAHLQEVSHDKHLRVDCSAGKLPPRGKGPSPQMRARMRAMQRRRNGGYRKVEVLPGNIGYLVVDGFMGEEAAAGPAAAAMNFLAHTDALIIDLRRNGGGGPTGVALLCSYLFDDKPVHLNDLYWRKGNRTEHFWTRKEVAGKRYLGRDVFLLTSARTFSAAEEFCYNLQCLKRVTLVGETTGGGAHPGGGFPVGEHFVMFIPTGRAINPITKTNWEGTGVKPDVAVPADQALEKAQELAVKKLLEKATDEDTRRLLEMDLKRGKEPDPPAKKTARQSSRADSPSPDEPSPARDVPGAAAAGVPSKAGQKLGLPTGPAPVQVLAKIAPGGKLVIKTVDPTVFAAGPMLPGPGPLPGGVPPGFPPGGPGGGPGPLPGFGKAKKMKLHEEKYDLADVQVLDAKGKKVPSGQLRKLLKEETAAMASMWGQKVDPLHLRVLTDGILIFVLPARGIPGAPPGVLPGPPPGGPGTAVGGLGMVLPGSAVGSVAVPDGRPPAR